MSIEVQAKKVIVRGIQMWKITRIKMLKRTQLPVKYTDEALECMYLHSTASSIIYRNTSPAPETNINFLVLQSFIKDQAFQEKLNIITRCGGILKQINKDLSKVNKGWKGDETFTI